LESLRFLYSVLIELKVPIITQVYNLQGRNAGFNIGTDYSVGYGYESTGRVAQVVDLNDTFDYTYAANSNLLASMSSSVTSTNYSYEPNRDLRTVVENLGAGATPPRISRYTHQYDSIGRRSNRIQEGTAFAQNTFDNFAYNTRSEVTESNRFIGTDVNDMTTPVGGNDFAFDFDNIGNRISFTENAATTSYISNDLNQYTTINADNPTYDADGNLTSDGSRLFTWNDENRLIMVEPLVPVNGDERVTHLYDYRCRRVQKVVEEFKGEQWRERSRERFVYDDWNLTLVLDGSDDNTLTKTYTWGLVLSQTLQGAGGVGGLLSFFDITIGKGQGKGHDEAIGKGHEKAIGIGHDREDVFYYTYDVNGNVVQMIDETGAISAAYEYGPFGELIRSSGPLAQENPFRFSTKFTDEETGLLYYGFRYYDSGTGRWLSREPIDEEGFANMRGYFAWIGSPEEENLYRFVNNSGFNLIDVLGMYIETKDDGGWFGKEFTVELTVEKCEILILFGHLGGAPKINTPEGCSAAGAVTCDSKDKNSEISRGNRLPNSGSNGTTIFGASDADTAPNWRNYIEQQRRPIGLDGDFELERMRAAAVDRAAVLCGCDCPNGVTIREYRNGNDAAFPEPAPDKFIPCNN